MTRIARVAGAAAALWLPATAQAQESNEELARKLNNPVAGEQRVSLGGTVKVYAAREEGGPEWGARFIATFLFPR